jgi:hypothetical protein
MTLETMPASGLLQMNSVTKYALGSLLLLLHGLAFAQEPSQATAAAPPSNSVLSEAEGVKHVQPSAPDAPTDSDTDTVADPASLLPDVPPVPRTNATLIGGTIERLDRVRDQMAVSVFGGGRMIVLFDPRTRIYRGAEEATMADLRDGERVSIDTILDGSTVFARVIRLKTTQAQGETQGIVLKVRADRGELTIRDAISPTPIRVRIDSTTQWLQGGRAVSAGTLAAGSLVAIQFSSDGNGRDLARQVSILALPGDQYTFAGEIANLDLRTGLLVLKSSTDRKTYEIYLDPSAAPDDNLHIGSVVTVVANFQGSRYVARNLMIESQAK